MQADENARKALKQKGLSVFTDNPVKVEPKGIEHFGFRLINLEK